MLYSNALIKSSCVFSLTGSVFCGFWLYKRHNLQEKRQSLYENTGLQMNLFLQALSFILQAVSFLCKFCLWRGQNLQKTELVIEKTKLARACNTTSVYCDCKLCLFSYKLCLLWILASQKTKLAREKTQLVRKDRICFCKFCLFSYKLCLFYYKLCLFSCKSYLL